MFSVAERDVPGIRPGASIVLRVDAHPDRSFAAKVRAISPAGNDRTRTFRVELELTNDPQSVLLPGMSGKARVVRQKLERVLLIPEAAILRDGAKSYIFVAVDGRAVRRDVEILAQTGSLAVVGAGSGGGGAETDSAELSLECIILGQAAVSDGAAIRVRRSHSEPPRLAFD